MGPSSVNGSQERDGSAAPTETPTPDLVTLLGQLQSDRVWLLQQIDAGRWPDLRLDLAALERELGQLLEQAQRRLDGD
jgi:hypothetical protein